MYLYKTSETQKNFPNAGIGSVTPASAAR